MFELKRVGFKGLGLLEKIEFLNKFFIINGIDVKDFERFGLHHPINDVTPITISCMKCRERRHNHKPKTKFSCKSILGHLYSNYHDIDELEYPTRNSCVQIIYLISFFAQLGYLGGKSRK